MNQKILFSPLFFFKSNINLPQWSGWVFLGLNCICNVLFLKVDNRYMDVCFLLYRLRLKYFVITHFSTLFLSESLDFFVGGGKDASLALNRQIHEDVWLRMCSQYYSKIWYPLCARQCSRHGGHSVTRIMSLPSCILYLSGEQTKQLNMKYNIRY